MAALELTPSAAGIPEAPWPPATQAKRGVKVAATDSFLDICNREKCKFADLVKLNFQIDIASAALRGKWEKLINYYLRTKLGCTRTTPGGNYKFSGGETIFVPVSSGPIDTGETIKTPRAPQPLTPDEKNLVQFGKEFKKEFEKPFLTDSIQGKVKVALAGKFTVLSSDQEIKLGNFGDIGLAITQQITDDITIQVGTEIKFVDLLHRNGGNLLQTLREKLAATVECQVFSRGNFKIAFSSGMQASLQPIIVGGKGQWEGKRNVGAYVGVESLPVAISAELSVTFEFGPTPFLLQKFGLEGLGAITAGEAAAAGGVVLFMIGFMALGIWDYGVRRENAEKVGLLSHYITAYRTEIMGRQFGDDTGITQPGPEFDMRAKGRADAINDARKSFSGFGESPQIVYFKALLLATAKEPGDNVANARRRLEKILWRKLEKTYPPLKAPVSAWQ